jgi:UDP-glucose 4-epimerase
VKVAITGSGGFIGNAVKRQLPDAGIVEIDRRYGQDIRSSDLHALFRGCDAVIHLAGVLGTSELFDNVQEAIDVNVTGTLRVLEACRDVGVGYVGITMHDKFPSVYTATKLAATRLASAFHNAYELPVCHVRAFNAYGPGQAYGPGHPRKIIPAMSIEGWSNEPITVWGDGNQTVDLIHTDELARILVEATQFGDDCTIDAGTGVALPVNQIAELVIEVTESKAGIRYLPMRPGEVASRICAEGVGWERLSRPPRQLPELRETIASYQSAIELVP